jgi:hypothetical protein
LALGHACGQPIERARDHVHGHFVQMFGEVGRGVDDLAGRVVDASCALHRPFALGDVRRVRAPVHVGQRGALVGVVDHQPTPPLHVAPGGCLRGNSDAVEHDVAGDGPAEIEALAHRPRGREQVIDLLEVERRHGRPFDEGRLVHYEHTFPVGEVAGEPT